MRLDIITLFPRSFDGPFSQSIIKRAQDKQLVAINIVDLRDFTEDRYQSVDDRPYGGGPGMVMKPEPLFLAVETLKKASSHVVLLTPHGQPFDQEQACSLSKQSHLICICGHYEGVDERVRIQLVDAEISIGDYILSNGNLAAMVLADTVIRLLPGVLGASESLNDESFSHGYLEYPQYTRPATFRGMKVPEVLLSGAHRRIAEWRREQAIQRTKARRPDLLIKVK